MNNKKIVTSLLTVLMVSSSSLYLQSTTVHADKATQQKNNYISCKNEISNSNSLKDTFELRIDKVIDFEQDKKKADEWGKKNYEELNKKLNAKEVRALENYVGESYREINEYLRENNGNVGLNSKIDEKISNIDNALKKSKTNQAINVYRRVNEEAFNLKDGDLKEGLQINTEKFKEFKEQFLNKTITENAFMSTSLIKDPKIAWKSRPILLHLTLPKGSNATYVTPFRNADPNDNEYELLVDRGYSYNISNISIITEKG
ncbi:ADP-ribosyltransferase, partial [Bacillus thuringiensis]|uniref:ADP-ribosyltransferase n=2 Tax=Bacillaceae TaxID=186817 RepID=UPI000CD8250B